MSSEGLLDHLRKRTRLEQEIRFGGLGWRFDGERWHEAVNPPIDEALRRRALGDLRGRARTDVPIYVPMLSIAAELLPRYDGVYYSRLGELRPKDEPYHDEGRDEAFEAFNGLWLPLMGG